MGWRGTGFKIQSRYTRAIERACGALSADPDAGDRRPSIIVQSIYVFITLNIGVIHALPKAKASEGFYHGRSGFNDMHKGGTGISGIVTGAAAERQIKR